MITYRPSPHFMRSLNELDDYLKIKWSEREELLEIWSVLPNKRPVMEHKFCRNNRNRLKPLYNWDMEWIVLAQMRNARRWQHMSAVAFQQEMLDKRDKFRADGEKEADEKMEGFLKDKYWHKKRLQERDNNDYGKCVTQWAGSETNPEGKLGK